MGATNLMERVAASMGKIDEATISFERCADVPCGGVMLSLPALLLGGLLTHIAGHFTLPAGYYGVMSIFILLGFMALARIKAIEGLRYCAPGEWGKLLGLDRIPEVRTMRKKVSILALQDPASWSAELCRQWMEETPESAGFLYIDGHVRVYHGHQTALPRHYVSRERLCQRATTDYWVNMMDGQPFFVVTREVDPGMLEVLRNDIVPRLERDVPMQPSLVDLMEEPRLHRFTLIFDREGYSPGFFKEMRQKHIACLTYHKYPKGEWPENEFKEKEVALGHGALVKMNLAERKIELGGIEVREVRKLRSSGHQTSVLSTDYVSDLTDVAGAMFSRWSQENFFRYMRQHFNLDRIIEHKVEEVPGTTRVVNPSYRELDGQVRRSAATRGRKMAEFGKLMMQDEIEPDKMKDYCQKKAKLQEDIGTIEEELATLKTKRKQTPNHITFDELPAESKFSRLRENSKQFIDTIKMIAYRAETAMVNRLREKMSREDDARSLVKSIYQSEADIVPDVEASTLTVHLHAQANKANDEAIRYLCDELSSTQTRYPATSLRLVFKLGSEQIGRDPEV